jgi:hypothetical protein
MAKHPCVYIPANRRNGTLYIGMTSDLLIRIGVHKQDLIEGFTKRYGVHSLVYKNWPLEGAVRKSSNRSVPTSGSTDPDTNSTSSVSASSS